MLIYSILMNEKKKLRFLGKSDENIELIGTQITEFKKHGITVDLLKESVSNTDNKYLKCKMEDMLLVYDRFQNNINTRQNYNNKQEGQQYQEPQQEIKQHKVGSFMAMVDVFNAVFKKRKNGPKIPKQLKREDWLAGVITIAIVLILGIILWFIPATNGFIRSLNPFS